MISEQTVQRLIIDQFPEWADLPIRQVRSTGTVNTIFRIGPGLTARFPHPRGETSADQVQQLLLSEMYAGKRLHAATGFRTPEPIAIGQPGHGYPLPWSVQTWLPGITAVDDDPGESEDVARDVAKLITEMRAAGTDGRTFGGHGRGGVLATQDEWVQICLRNSVRLLPVRRLAELWRQWRELPRGLDPDVMAHGDLMPGNVLVADGRLTGVLDTGGFAPADPALDLTSAWHLLEHGPRKALRSELACDDAEWARGRAWAFAQSMGLVWFYRRSNPVMSRIGRRTLERILADA